MATLQDITPDADSDNKFQSSDDNTFADLTSPQNYAQTAYNRNAGSNQIRGGRGDSDTYNKRYGNQGSGTGGSKAARLNAQKANNGRVGSSDRLRQGTRSPYEDGQRYNKQALSSDNLRDAESNFGNNNPGFGSSDRLRQGTRSPYEDGQRYNREGASPDSLKDAESNAAQDNNDDDQLGHGYTGGPGGKGKGKVGGKMSSKAKKKLAAAGAGLAVSAMVGVVTFLGSLGLKVEHMISNLEQHFFSSSQDALENETDKLFANYVKKYVTKGYTKCGTTISKECSAIPIIGPNSNPVTKLYKDWRNIKMENKLATKYDITIEKHSDGSWALKTASGEATLVDKEGNLTNLLRSSDRSEIRTAFNNAIKTESKATEVYHRYRFGRLLEEKYGIRRCLIFCGVTDPLANKLAAQKTAAKLFLTERVITPRSQALGVAITCFLDPECHPEDTKDTDADPATHGEPQSETDKEIGQGFKDLAAKYGVEDVEALQKAYKAVSEKGISKFLSSKILSQIVGEEAADTAADKIPIVGWIDLGNRIFKALNNAGPKLKKLSYVINAAAAVKLYSMYRTYADEIHTGNVTATEVGSMVDSLGPGTDSASDPEIGGNAPAEDAPLYSSLIEGETPTKTPSDYKCNDGSNVNVSKGEMVCPEERLGQGNSIFNMIHAIIQSPLFINLRLISRVWSDTIGKLFDGINYFIGGALNWAIKTVQFAADATCLAGHIPIIGGAINHLNPYCAAKDEIKALEPKLLNLLANDLFPNPIGDNMSGARTFDMVAAGSDVAGNDSAHTNLGGQALTPQQTATIMNRQSAEVQQTFTQESFFARMFDTSSPYSLLSKLAMDIPFSLESTIQHSFVGLIANPFSALSHAFASVFTTKAFALATPTDDPFGVTQYGYPDGTIPDDPATYWKETCKGGADGKFTKAWNKAAADGKKDPSTGMPVNTTVNPCLLIQSTVESVGATMDASLLTSDDAADIPAD
ncbi:MAG TPA: hypothetical protein VG992_01985 [Candidatus Saccharimonadales bacterium]|nr:hypothetical protein [Candidatus Saccharimonadales bacterium]